MSIYKVANKVIRDFNRVMEANIKQSDKDDLMLNIVLAAPVLAKEILKGKETE